MKIYVASEAENRDEAKDAMRLLFLHRHQITRDWTTCYGRNVENAEGDLQGVTDCDVFIGLFTKDLPYRGALVELGAALALKKQVFIIGPYLEPCIFSHLKECQKVSCVADVIDALASETPS